MLNDFRQILQLNYVVSYSTSSFILGSSSFRMDGGDGAVARRGCGLKTLWERGEVGSGFKGSWFYLGFSIRFYLIALRLLALRISDR